MPRALAGPGRASEGVLHHRDAKVLLQACCPTRPALAGAAPLTWLPEQTAPQTTAESSCAPEGSSSNSRDNEVTRHRGAPAAVGRWLPADTLTAFLTAGLLRLSEGICHKAWWAGRRPPRQLARCCLRDQPCPQVSEPFLAPLFPFWNSCPPPSPLHQLPCFSLADKACFSTD